MFGRTRVIEAPERESLKPGLGAALLLLAAALDQAWGRELWRETMRSVDRCRRGLGRLPLALALALAPAVSGAGGLEELGSLEQAKGLFNRDAGKPRLLLLLSPT